MKTLKILTISLCILSFNLLSSSNFTSSERTTDDQIQYSITIEKEQPKIAKMQVVFNPKNDTLYMHWGASQLPKRWATFVHNVRVESQSGTQIELVALEGAEWKMKNRSDEKVTLTYEVHLDHEAYEWSGGIDGVAFATELGVFYTGRTLLILNGDSWSNIIVDFNIPEDWKVSTPWKQIEPEKNSYQPTTYSDLIDAMIFAGKHKEVSLKRSDFELVFALGSEDIVSRESEFQSLASGVLDYYIDLMGGIPNPSPENPFHKAVVVICSAEVADGEAIGNNISILMQKDGDPFSEIIGRFIFAHEFFHLWNGKSFTPENTDSEWFKEGVSNYYTIKALHHVGFLNDESYLELLSNFFYMRYSTDPGVGSLSMSDGSLKHDHWGLVYGGGMMVGIAQDINIRKATNNEKSMDDIMRFLHKNYGGTTNSYSKDTLEELFYELNGTSQETFFNNYIYGTIKIPVEDYLRQIGLNAQVSDGKLVLSKKESATSEEQTMMKGVFGTID